MLLDMQSLRSEKSKDPSPNPPYETKQTVHLESLLPEPKEHVLFKFGSIITFTDEQTQTK